MVLELFHSIYLHFSRKLRFLVTGGCGHFGYELATAIHGLGGHVTLFDLQLPQKIVKHLDKSLIFIKVCAIT